MGYDRKQIHPWLQYKLKLLEKRCKKAGTPIGIGECFRTVKEQDALYAIGRTKSKGRSPVTNARGKGYYSQHQWGIAADFYLAYDANRDGKVDAKDSFYNKNNEFKKIAKIAKKVGLAWGGDWKSIVDNPHLYLSKWGSTTSKLRKKYENPRRFKKEWKCKVKYKTAIRKGRSFTSKTLKTYPVGTSMNLLWKSKLGYAKVEKNGLVGYIRMRNIK